MRRSALVLHAIFFCILLTAGTAAAAPSIMRNTKHDLSSSSTASIRSSVGSGTTELCVFCHTPHSAKADAPLWNRSDVSGPYTVYSSDVLSALGYPSPDQPTTKLGAGAADVHVKTRICLSCHDGTIALGNLVNLPQGITIDIPMVASSGVSGGKMAPAAAGYLGLDLQDDHPVAVAYLSSGGGADPELSAAVPAQVKLYSSGGAQYVECTSCHNAHDNRYGNFLVMSNKNSALCAGCHVKAGYDASSIHSSSSLPYSPSDGTAAGTLGGTVGEVKCMDCHFPHKAGVLSSAPANPNPNAGRYLLSFQEEASCFNYNSSNPSQTDRWNTPAASGACHGSPALGTRRDIQDLTGGGGVTGRTYGHHAGNYSNIHRATEDRNITKPGNANYNWVNTAPYGWHVECQDCHNSHTAGDSNHTPPTNVIAAGSPLWGAGGESMSVSPAWPNGSGSYSYREPLGLVTLVNSAAQYEYEICFKCHSDFAWAANPPLSPSLGAPMTNQAMEFGSNSVSFHPVVNTTGRTAGRLVNTAIAPASWGAIGTNTMFCSDCHTKEGYGIPKGPHGSSRPFILGNNFESQYGARGAGDSQKQPLDLCFDCHDQGEYRPTVNGQVTTGTGFYQSGTNINLHTQHAFRSVTPITPALNPYPYRCVNCHMRNAHGNDKKAMIVLSTDASQYRPGAGMISLYNAQSGGYVISNCTTVSGCHIP